MDNKKHTLIINGQKVHVTEEVYRAYSQGKRKDRYMAKDLKANKFVIDGESVIEIPGREDSYDRLLELDKQFPDTKEPLPEDAVCKAEMLQALGKALHMLTDEQFALVHELFYLEKTEREVSAALHMSKTTLHRKKERVLAKLRELIEK